MEIFLIIILIIVFVISINSLSRKIDRLQDSFFEVNKRLDHYKKLAETAERPVVTPPLPTSTVQERPKEQPATVPPVIPITPVAEKPAAPVPAPPQTPSPKPAEALPRVASIQASNPAPQPQRILPPQKSWWENFKEQNPDLEKFIGENLINKIGILILVLGISYFVKFAIDKDWIGEPARVGIGVLAGGIVMLVAHKLRVNFKAFSSVFQKQS